MVYTSHGDVDGTHRVGVTGDLDSTLVEEWGMAVSYQS